MSILIPLYIAVLLGATQARLVQRDDLLNLFNETHPVIVVGLPKSGTTSVTQFLRNFRVKAAHQFINPKHCADIWPVPPVTVDNGRHWRRIREPTKKCFIGELIQLAISENKPPLFYLFEAGIYAASQMDVCYDIDIWPQIDALSYLIKAYPKAYFIHTVRPNISAHANSMLHWSDLSSRMKANGQLSRFHGQSREKSIFENTEIFINAAHHVVRHHFKHLPHYNFLELAVQDPDSGRKLAKFLNIDVGQDYTMPHANPGNYEEKQKKVTWFQYFTGGR